MITSLTKEVIMEELALAQRVLTKWQQSLDRGIPNVELPGDEYSRDLYEQQLCGELYLLAGKLERLAQILGDTGA